LPEGWIKRFERFSAGQIYGQMVYDEKSGNMVCFDGYYSVFDLTGKTYRFGRYEFDSIESFQPYHAEKLDDGTFFSFGTFWTSNHGPDGYYIFRAALDGTIRFTRELKDEGQGNWWTDTDLMRHDNKIKIVYRFNDSHDDDFLRISTLSENGTLVSSKLLSISEDHFNIEGSGFALFPIDIDHYGIVANGQFINKNEWLDGIVILTFSSDDKIIGSKWFYDPHWDTSQIQSHGYRNLIITRDDDNGFYILARKENTETICILKIDTEWKLKWSKEYILEFADGWNLKPVNAYLDDNGYTAGITIENESKIHKFYPAIMRTNKNGNPVWAKKFHHPDLQFGYLTDIIKLPNGGMCLAANYFFILDANGEVPGGCNFPEEIAFGHREVAFLSCTPDISDFILTNSSLLIEDVNFTFRGDNSDNGDTLCQYETLKGEAVFIEERSLFAGYLIHKINFTVDPVIMPFISKFKIFRKSISQTDYLFVSDITKEAGKTSYTIMFTPMYSSNFTYKIVAVNSKDEVVDIAYLTKAERMEGLW